ncbi:MAG: outer membrane beta-barrel protein [Halieaceae bacterium]|jgi:opacity protein-like surface antigen|nr:outer membrane beta-barrel protein [Halieaceae bacterium]
MKSNTLFARSALGALLIAAPMAQAADLYVGGSVGYVDMDDIDTDGNFTSDFVTGQVTDVPGSPLTIPAGESVNWDTELDSGYGIGLVFGMKFDLFSQSWRAELEYSYTTNDVDSHSNVTAAGIGLDPIDAGILLTGNTEDLGVTTGDLVNNGQGEVETNSLFVNAYYDFKTSTNWTPFIGVGIGYSNVDVDYSPSNVGIIDEDDDVFAWQVMGGVSYAFNEQFELTGSVRYRETDEADLNSDLLPASFDIETESLIVDLGIRYNFSF